MGYTTPKIVLLFFIALISNVVISQTEVRSKISDILTFLPVENASVYVKNSTIGTVSNSDGRFVLQIPERYVNDTLIISSIGYKSYKSVVSDFNNSNEVFLEEDIASLDEVVVMADTRPTTANEIVLRAIKRLPRNLPEDPYLQKGFMRHKERNKKEYKWLIESAITLYDSSFASGSTKNLKINIDETRKSYDLRDVDSLFTYYSYLKYNAKNVNLNSKKLDRDTIATSSLVKAIKWNDNRVNGLQNLFKGKLNLLRNSAERFALFGKDLLEKHQFNLDTILVDNDRKIYKIKIEKGTDFVGLNTENIFNEGYEAQGWVYIYWDNFAIKRIEYELVAASDAQKRRSKSLFGTQVNHKLIVTYLEYGEKMYLNYIYYETPKLVTIDRSSEIAPALNQPKIDKDELHYYTIQEILFTEIILDEELIDLTLSRDWDSDIFKSRPYNQDFWKNYNILLESDEEEKLIQDLSKRATLFKQ